MRNSEAAREDAMWERFHALFCDTVITRSYLEHQPQSPSIGCGAATEWVLTSFCISRLRVRVNEVGQADVPKLASRPFAAEGRLCKVRGTVRVPSRWVLCNRLSSRTSSE